MSPIVLSPSTINICQECKRCFWLRINKGVKRPEGIYPSLPSGMDNILKKHFDVYREKDILPPELEGKVKGKLFNDIEKLREWRDNKKGLRFVNDEGIILMGVLDDLMVTDEGLHVVLDFKTRGYPLKDNTASFSKTQMDIYTFLLHKNGFPVTDFACLIYYHPDCVEGHGKFKFNVDVAKISTDIKNVEKLFQEAIDVIRGPMPPANPNCPFCCYRKISI